MKCPHCSGTGERKESYTRTGGDSDTWTEWCTVQCDTCDGVGAVIEETKWLPELATTCAKCNGAGKVYEEYVAERYPSGKAVKYRNKKVTCKSCRGRGEHIRKGYYAKIYRPDYKARKGGCFISTASLAFTEAPEAELLLSILREFRDTYVLGQPGGRQLITDYYCLAPRIVSELDNMDDPGSIYHDLYERLVLPCVADILEGHLATALARYEAILKELCQRFLPCEAGRSPRHRTARRDRRTE